MVSHTFNQNPLPTFANPSSTFARALPSFSQKTRTAFLYQCLPRLQNRLSLFSENAPPVFFHNQVLAIYLKGQKRTKEAVAVMKRMHAMEEELAGVPQEEDGEEEGAA